MKRYFFRGHNSNGIVQFFSRFMPVQRSSKSEAVSLRTRLGGCGNPVESHRHPERSEGSPTDGKQHNFWRSIFLEFWSSLRSRPLLSIFSLVLIILIPIYYLTVKFTNPASEAAWFDESFQYRKAVNITNSSGGVLTDFQVSISIGTSAPIATGKMKSDCSDIRITDQNGKLLPHWIEENNPGCNAVTDAKVWVKAPLIPTSGGILYVYYGNPNASNIADGNGVFEFFDDFSQDLNKWINVSNAPWSISSGILNLTTGSPYNYLTANKSISASEIAIEARIKSNHTTGQSHPGLFWHANNLSGISSHRNDHVYLRPHSYNTTSNIQSAYHNGGLATSSSFTGLFNFNTWHNVKIEIPSTNSVKFYRDDVNEANFGGQQYLSNTYTGIVGHDGSNMQWDNYRVRKIASTQPTTSISTTEEKSLGPVAYWKFDEGNGTTTYNSAGKTKNGSISGATWLNEDQCISGKCLYFDGANDQVTVGIGTDYFPLSTFSLCTWAKTPGLGSGQIEPGVFGLTYGLRFNYNNSGQFYTDMDNGSTFIRQTAPDNLFDNKFHHLCLTYDGTNRHMYVDGIEKISAATTWLGTTRWPTNQFNIGRDNNNGNEFFKGVIDEPKVYSYARTAAQIRTDYNSGLARQSSSKGASVSMGSPGASNLSNGLVGYWKMDETATNFLDSSGNNNTGTWIGSVSSTAGKFGNGANVPTSAYVNVGTNSLVGLTGSNLTFAGWVRFTSCTSANTLLAMSNQYWVAFYQSGANCAATYADSSSWNFGAFGYHGAITTGTWHHVAVTKDPKHLVTIYVDGLPIISKTFGGDIVNTGSNLNLGGNGVNYALNGDLDEVRMYNRALSPKEVTDLYNFAPGPIGYWDFEEGVGSTAYDKSGNGNSGILTNGPVWTSGKFGKGIKFDGVNDYISAGTAVSDLMERAGTVSMWVNPITSGGLFSRSNGSSWINERFSLHMYGASPAGAPVLALSNGTSYWNHQSATVLPLSKWTHVAVNWDGSYVNFYYDGTLVKKVAQGGTPEFTGVKTWIGAVEGLTPNNFSGSMDEVKIYDYARTQGQIVEDMNGGHPVGGSPVGSQVGYWKMDEGYGTVANNSGSGGTSMNGFIQNGPGWVLDGKFNKAIGLNGSNAYIEVISNSALKYTGGDFTFTTWYKPDSSDDGGRLISKPWNGSGQYNYGIDMGGGANPTFSLSFSGATGYSLASNKSISSGDWHHLAFSINGATKQVNIYVDGVLTNSGTHTITNWTPTLGDADQSLAIGTYYPYGSGTWNYPSHAVKGKIDEVKIYNAVLSADEIKTDYNRGQAMQMGTLSSGVGNTASSNAASQEYCVPGDTASCLPPVAEYKFEEGSGNTAQDSSGNNLGVGFTGAPTRVSGKNGKALKLNGTSDYLAGTRKVLSGNLSLGAWIKTTSNDSAKSYAGNAAQNVIGDSTGGVALGFGVTGGKAQYNYYTSLWNTVDGTSTINDGKWHYIAVTHKSDGSVILYVDGKQEATSTLAYNGSSAFNVIGRGYSADLFTGQLDDVRIYNYVRTPVQVSWDYNHGAPVAWWKMDECQGVSLNDSSGNNLIGNINIGASGSQTTAGNCSTAGTAWGVGATGRFNSGINFDGTDDYATANMSVSGSNATISFWVKNPTQSTGQYLLRSNANIRTYIMTDSVSFTFMKGNPAVGVGSVSAPASGMWSHLVLKWWTESGTQYSQAYLNGVSIRSPVTFLDSTAGTYITVAGFSTTGTQNTSGQFDDLKVFNYSLTDTQIKALYNNGAINFGPATGSP